MSEAEQKVSTLLTNPQFATTHWSVVLTGSRGEPAQVAVALEELCRAYWYPLYAYVRRRGHSVEEAQDLTQEFFARLIDKQWLTQADAGKGRFRTFPLTALNHFLANEWRHSEPCALFKGTSTRPRFAAPFTLRVFALRFGVSNVQGRKSNQVGLSSSTSCVVASNRGGQNPERSNSLRNPPPLSGKNQTEQGLQQEPADSHHRMGCQRQGDSTLLKSASEA